MFQFLKKNYVPKNQEAKLLEKAGMKAKWVTWSGTGEGFKYTTDLKGMKVSKGQVEKNQGRADYQRGWENKTGRKCKGEKSRARHKPTK